MTAQPNPPPLFSTDQKATGLSSDGAPTQPFYWSVLREMWENKAIFIAPAIVSGVVLLGGLSSVPHLPKLRRAAMLLDENHRRAAIEMPYNMVATMFIITAFIVGFFYCLDALYGERRDRSVLFWKSLPVSDSTTVLSKICIPLVIVPAVIFVAVVLTQALMLLITSAALASSGLAGTTWANFSLLRESVILLYGLVVIALWHAPLYGWALLISGIARRATFLWSVLPPLVIAFFEKVTFNTAHFSGLIRDRLFGFAESAFHFELHHGINVDSLTPQRYFSSAGLWIGLLFAVVFVAVALRLRRYRGPL